MTAALPELAAVDPHAPKMSPDDPRLRLERPASRTLRAAPIVALTGALGGAVALAVGLALQAPPKASAVRPDPSGTPAPPVVPDAIRNALASSPLQHVATVDAGGPVRSVATRGEAPEDSARRLEQERSLKAQNAEILFASAPGGAEQARVPEAPRAPEASGAAASLGGAEDPNLQDRKNAFLAGRKSSDTLMATLQHPKSPYEIQAGTVIPAVLITAINSDLPGPVIGQVRESVYDSVSGNFLLIPQGSRLLAHYDSMVAWGQERVLLCWNRLILPNGDSLNLQCMPAADLTGAAGLTDSVDEHWFRIVKGAAVASLLAATTQAVAGNTDSYNPTVPQMWAHRAAGEVGQAGQRITARNLNVQPTITVRAGFSVNVVVTQDMTLPPYPDRAWEVRP